MASEGAAWSWTGVVLDLNVDPTAPAQNHEHKDAEEHKNPAEKRTLSAFFGPRLRLRVHLRLLALQDHDDFVGGDGAFAEDLRVAVAEERSTMVVGWCAAVGPPSTMRGMLVAELVADAGGVVHSGCALEVGGGGGDGQAEALDDGAGDGGFGHAQGDVAGVGGDAQGQLGAGADDDGEGAGPEALGEAVEGGVDVAGELVGLGRSEMSSESGLWRAGFDLVDALDGAEIDGVDGEAVEGVGGQSDNVALCEDRRRCSRSGPVRVRRDGRARFPRTIRLPWCSEFMNAIDAIADVQDGSYHSTSRGAS